jgi:hypothetical protein
MAWGFGPAKAELEPGGAGFFGDGAGAKASRLLWRKLSPFPGAMGLPADASGAYRPNPQATTKLAFGGFSVWRRRRGLSTAARGSSGIWAAHPGTPVPSAQYSRSFRLEVSPPYTYLQCCFPRNEYFPDFPGDGGIDSANGGSPRASIFKRGLSLTITLYKLK